MYLDFYTFFVVPNPCPSPSENHISSYKYKLHVPDNENNWYGFCYSLQSIYQTNKKEHVTTR